MGYSSYSPGLLLELWQNRAGTKEIPWLTSLTCLLSVPLRKNYTNLFLSLCTGIYPLTYLWKQVKKSLRAGHCIMPVYPPTRRSPIWNTCQRSSNVADEIIYSVSFSNYLPPDLTHLTGLLWNQLSPIVRVSFYASNAGKSIQKTERMIHFRTQIK